MLHVTIGVRRRDSEIMSVTVGQLPARKTCRREMEPLAGHDSPLMPSVFEHEQARGRPE
jgi:hypothetical protein